MTLAVATARRSDRWVIALFVLTAFVGAGLLFVVQPMVARVLLPAYGGSATVWSTSSLFFQVMLLVGYLYTHYATRLLSRRLQRRAHVLVLLLPLLVLPLALPADAAPAQDASPVMWLLRTLLLMIALPFFVVATTGPLVQAWYSWSDRPRAQDPYFLFAASNLGSFVGLLGYPFLIEPFLTVREQLDLWSLTFVAFAVLVIACSVIPVRRAADSAGSADSDATADARSRVTRGQLWRWLAWSFLPSALMLSTTSHISTDIAAIPLLWVLPLALYLATFVAAFARTGRHAPLLAVQIATVLAVLASFTAIVPAVFSVTAAVVLQLVTLTAVAYAAHARLAASRPAPEALTRFYLVVAVGGALGGLLNGVIAPIVFDRVLEHGLLLASVPALLLGLSSRRQIDPKTARRRRIAALVFAILVLSPIAAATVADAVTLSREYALVALAVGSIAVGIVLLRLPWLLLGVLVIVQLIVLVVDSASVIERRRTFYGSYTVTATDEVHRLTHGTTLHGLQFLDERRTQPTTYYAESGPLGDVFGADREMSDVAVVGLGVGTVAAYGESGQTLTFFEIDGDIVEVAKDERYFTYLSDSAAEIETVVGDGRLQLEEMPDATYDLIVLDAFSSDAIPVHLLTAEAFTSYAEKLAPGGRLAVHISNRVFDLRPVVAAAASDLGWSAMVGENHGEQDEGATSSTWVLMAATDDDLGVAAGQGWEPLDGPVVRWTDDYSSVLSVLR